MCWRRVRYIAPHVRNDDCSRGPDWPLLGCILFAVMALLILDGHFGDMHLQMIFRHCFIPLCSWFYFCLHMRCCWCLFLFLWAYLHVICLEMVPLLKFQHLLLKFQLSILGSDFRCRFRILCRCCALMDFLCCLALLVCRCFCWYCRSCCDYRSQWWLLGWQLPRGWLVGQLEPVLCRYLCPHYPLG